MAGPALTGSGEPWGVAPAGEVRRLAAVANLAILDTEPEPEFDRIAAMAARHLGTPVGLVSFLDDRREWVKAAFGRDRSPIAAPDGFCATAIVSRGVTVVPDATRDWRFSGRSLVTSDPKYRFYAGVPILSDDGEAVGTVSVLDPSPCTGLTTEQMQLLTELAAIAQDHLRARAARLRATAGTAPPPVSPATALPHLTAALALAKAGTWRASFADRSVIWSDDLFDLLGQPHTGPAPTLADPLPDVAAADRPAMQAALTRLEQTGQPQTLDIALRQGAVTRECRLMMAPMHEGGAVTGLIGLLQDVTEWRQREQAHLRSERLKTIGQLTGGVAHDFNNLLTVVTLNLEEAIDTLPPESELHEVLQPAMEAALRGADLTQELMAYARRAVLRPERVSLTDFFRALRPLVSRTLGKRYSLRLLLRHNATLMVDPAQLETAIINLVTNSRDAMPMGGEILVSTTATLVGNGAAGAAEFPDGPGPGHYVLISVADRGVGIAPEVLPTVFEPFVTTKDSGRGGGLGLSMVYGFAKQSGGHASVTSAVGEGTTVRLYLPVFDQPEAVHRVEQPTAELRVLIVEDLPEVLLAASRMLTQLGFMVDTAPSAEEAVQRLTSGRYDLLFTDVQLSGATDGNSLADWARRHDPTMHVLLTSGSAGHDRAARPDGMEMLRKPYSRQQLSDMLDLVFGGEWGPPGR